MSRTDIDDALLGILATHERKGGIRNGRIHCTCGWSRSILGMTSSKGAFRRHLADSILPLVEAREQEARRAERERIAAETHPEPTNEPEATP